ncbi:5-oxoprolinase subunit PxpB [Shimia sp. SDUM112013]|uniref:5-oxoprolinase subunit PxpB n=1 Tax=Shimia sp. SDUM112013 TaxID=3136160 RepID=UPI0032EE3C27
MTLKEPSFIPVADHALLVQVADAISDAATARVHQFDKAIQDQPPTGVLETIPAFVNLLVEFDPLLSDHDTLANALRDLWHEPAQAQDKGRLHEVSVCYDGDLAPDIASVAKAVGMSPEAVINMHLSGRYKVGMYGFAPGYAYLSGVPEPLQLPRKPAATRDIPAGSVLIAGPQCLVTTLTMPTGWSIIGRSPTQILRDDPVRPFLFDVGDNVQFVRMSHEAFHAQDKGTT